MFIQQAAGDDGIVLDFFAGSCSSAHAILRLNANAIGTRKFIMVQIPEPCDEKSIAFNTGYKNITDIGKERIRRVAEKIREGKNNLESTVVVIP